jgi:primase-polymerase (primpol)-like protein
MSCADALAAYREQNMNGVGLLLVERNPADLDSVGFVGIDLDGCRDPRTGELSDFARNMVNRFRTYWEISPSATGIKGLLAADFPMTSYTCPGLEIYGARRWFALTGHILEGVPGDVNPLQKEFDVFLNELGADRKPRLTRGTTATALGDSLTPGQLDETRCVPGRPWSSYEKFGTGLDDEAVLQKMLNNGAIMERVRSLWFGGWEEDPHFWRFKKQLEAEEPDKSLGDASLVRYLAFYTGPNPAQIDRLFRESYLMIEDDRQEKWDRGTIRWNDGANQGTYGERTIDLVLSGMEKFYHRLGKYPAEQYDGTVC